jgi:GNAT superfamily N-acetyltransferase
MSNPRFRIRQVADDRDYWAFVKFPWTVYRDDPNWVPPLVTERRAFIDPHKNPFFEHVDAAFFLAERPNGDVLGTIAATVDHNYNAFQEVKVGWFGLFEVVEEYAVAEALLSTARDWVRDQGMSAILGPVNLSTNAEYALLVDGFDSPPVIMMTYNPRYYVDFIERFGFEKARDLYAYLFEAMAMAQNLPRKLVRVGEATLQKGNIGIRKVNMQDWDNEIQRIKDIYNSAWEKLWGFVPMTEAEIDHLALQLKPLLDPDLLFIAEDRDRAVGVMVGLPDMNQALLKAHPGPSRWGVPWTLLKLLRHRRQITTWRGLITGVVEEYRGRGIEALFFLETGKTSLDKGYVHCEGSLILEDNTMMNRLARRLGGQAYKTYRVYELSV